MKNKMFLMLIILGLTASVNSQNKGGISVKTNKSALPKPVKAQSTGLSPTKPAKQKVEPIKSTKNKPDTNKARQLAQLGTKRHREIQSKIVTNKKGRQAEVRFSDSKTRKQMRADILTKSNRMFEIKPNTKSGRRQRSKNQLKKYEDASRKRGGMIYYEPQTGKYKFERTPYKEWMKRQQVIPTKEKTKQKRQQRQRNFRSPRIRF